LTIKHKEGDNMAVVYRTAFLEAYKQEVITFPFLTNFFRTTPRDIVNAEKVKVEIKRGGRYIAPHISAFTQKGGRLRKSAYTGKEFSPPTVALTGDFSPGDLIEKAFGQTEYQTADQEYMVQLMNIMIDTLAEIDPQIIRSVEFQISQIFQTGTMTLYDENGIAVFELNFYPKATHFPTVTVPWSDEDADPDSDIENLVDVIEEDGETEINNIVFSPTARKNYLANSKVNDKFDITRMASGTYSPTMRNPGVKFLGNLLIGARYFDCWEYTAKFVHPSTSTLTPFLTDENVLLLPNMNGPNVDFRLTYCRIPQILPPDPRFASILPAGMTNLDNRAYNIRVWGDDEADSLNITVKGRPLAIPVSIDTFGCLTTEL